MSWVNALLSLLIMTGFGSSISAWLILELEDTKFVFFLDAFSSLKKLLWSTLPARGLSIFEELIL